MKRANDNDLGLCSYVYTTDLKKANKASEILETGCVAVNTPVGSCSRSSFWRDKTDWIWKRRRIDGN